MTLLSSQYKTDRIVGQLAYRPRVYPFQKMDIGDSFYYPGEHDSKTRHRLNRITCYAARRLKADRGNRHQFKSVKVTGGWRIWRLT